MNRSKILFVVCLILLVYTTATQVQANGAIVQATQLAQAVAQPIHTSPTLYFDHIKAKS